MVVVKKCALAGCGGLLLACVAVATLCAVSLWPKTRTPPVDMGDLLIDVSVFPRGWHVSFGPRSTPERERGERESLYTEFSYEGLEPGVVGACHKVFRYRNELNVAAVYSPFLQDEFSNSYMVTPWAVPEQWEYESPIADRFEFACGEVDILGSIWRCEAVAQYDEYISVFYTLVPPEYMTLQDLERILVAIDELMANHLEKDTE